MEISNCTRFDLDRGILEFDKAIRVIFGEPAARRPSPAEAVPENSLDDGTRSAAAALMRVNHCGEVCAQALYQGQALASSNDGIKGALAKAAREEADHLAWSAQRVRELGGRLSFAGSRLCRRATGRALESRIPRRDRAAGRAAFARTHRKARRPRRQDAGRDRRHATGRSRAPAHRRSARRTRTA